MSCLIVLGIFTKEALMSFNDLKKAFPLALLAFITANSSLVGGYSDVVNTVTKIVPIEAIDPIANAQQVETGIPLSILSLKARIPKKN